MAGFSEILGHEQIIEHLQNAIKLQKVSHAYILDGEEGAGKNMLARAFAQTLQCERGGTEPCGECHSCKQAMSGNQPDIITVTHEKPASIGVEDIRGQLCGDIQIKPYSSPYKIYIVDEAEKMTVQAQNALLKAIEEPPAYGVHPAHCGAGRGFDCFKRHEKSGAIGEQHGLHCQPGGVLCGSAPDLQKGIRLHPLWPAGENCPQRLPPVICWKRLQKR